MKIPVFIKTIKTQEVVGLNFLFGIIGLVGVYLTTDSWLAVFWAVIAGLHLRFNTENL